MDLARPSYILGQEPGQKHALPEPIVRKMVPGSAYESRNVYKSVVRHLVTSVKKNLSNTRQMLKREGFSPEQIEKALLEVEGFRDARKPKDIERNSQVRVEKMLHVKSILTYILRDTLRMMLRKWERGDYGQLSTANSAIYINACSKFYEQAEALLKDRTTVAGP